MRHLTLKLPALQILSITSLTLFFTSPSFAGKCLPSTGPATDRVKFGVELESLASSTLGDAKAILFMVVDEENREVRSTKLVTLPFDQDRLTLPKELLNLRLRKGEKLYTFTRSTAAYILKGPATRAEELRKFSAEVDCIETRKSNRFIPGPRGNTQELSCETVTLTGLLDGIIAYDQSASRCTDVVNKHFNQKEAISILNSKYATGENRRPAGYSQSPIVTSKKLPVQEIGSSKPRSEKARKPGQTSESGN